MQIILENTGRRFNKDWIFKNISYTFSENNFYGITGPNGSGKSTLIQLLSGHLSPSEGKIKFLDTKEIPVDAIYKNISICSPMTELYEELTLSELIKFHISLKPLKNNMDQKKFCELVFLEREINKPIRLFSSGMKQRVKLGLAILSDTKILLLDEPCSNFDSSAIDWYKQLLKKNGENRIVAIASNNQEDELGWCKEIIKIEEYK